MTSGQVTAAANAFCQTVEEAGYQPMIYFNQYIGYLLYDLDQVVQYHSGWRSITRCQLLL